jgi:hypothetical protein
MGEIHMYGGKREEETKHVPLLLYLRFKNKKSTDILPIILRFRHETPNPVESGNFVKK